MLALQRSAFRTQTKGGDSTKGFIHPAAISLAFGLCIYAPAQGAQPVTSSIQITLAGAAVFVPLSDGSFDQVALSGMVHVVTHAAPGDPCAPTDPCRIQINLDQVSGVGDISGLRYNATGANRINLPSLALDSINLGFNLMPAPPPIVPPNPIIPLDISFIVTFNPDMGELMNMTIESMSVPSSVT
jgi:hypothetical protein